MILFIEGFLLLLSGLATFNYWGAIAFHTMAAVRWNSYQFSRLTQIITHSVCMGVPLLLAIIAVSTKSIQATPGAPFAYFRAITPTKTRFHFRSPVRLSWIVMCAALFITQSCQFDIKCVKRGISELVNENETLFHSPDCNYSEINTASIK